MNNEATRNTNEQFHLNSIDPHYQILSIQMNCNAIQTAFNYPIIICIYMYLYLFEDNQMKIDNTVVTSIPQQIN